MSAANTRPVVVGVDGSDRALAAVHWAAEAATLRNAPLHAVYAMSTGWELGSAATVSLATDRFRAEGEDALAQARAIAAAQGLDIVTSVVDPAPIPALRRRAATAQLVVVGTRGHGAFERALLGSVSSALARRLACPLAVIPGPMTQAAARLPVLVGLDGSPGSDRALDFAIEEASLRGVGLVAVRAWTTTEPGLRHSEMTERTHRLLADRLVGYGQKYPGVPITRIVTDEEPARRLLRESARAQLLVLGSHRRGTRDGFGSVSRTVLHATEIPLVLAGRD
ncbi:universal stress protein [Nocardia asteroides]